MCKKHEGSHFEQRCNHQIKVKSENNKVKLLHDLNLQNYKVIRARRLDFVLLDKLKVKSARFLPWIY